MSVTAYLVPAILLLLSTTRFGSQESVVLSIKPFRACRYFARNLAGVMRSTDAPPVA